MENNIDSTELRTETILDQKESIKLSRGQKGTYGWEIKILSLDTEQLKKIDAQLKKDYMTNEL
jgi:hypothetical protein